MLVDFEQTKPFLYDKPFAQTEPSVDQSTNDDILGEIREVEGIAGFQKRLFWTCLSHRFFGPRLGYSLQAKTAGSLKVVGTWKL